MIEEVNNKNVKGANKYFAFTKPGPLISGGYKFKSKYIVLGQDSDVYKFKRIIFIDDQMKYLREVESYCRKQGVDFFGVHYTESASAPVPELDLLLEKSRFNYDEQGVCCCVL